MVGICAKKIGWLVVQPRGGHSIVKLNSTCETIFLWFYPYIIWHRFFFNFMIFFYIYIIIDSIFFNIFLKFLVMFIFYSNCFSSIMRHYSWKRYVLLKKHIIKFGYHSLICNKYRVYILMIDKILIRFCDATLKFFCLARDVLLDNGVTSPCVQQLWNN